MRKSSINKLTVLDALVSFLSNSVLVKTRDTKRFYSFNTLSLFAYQALCPLSLLLYCYAWLLFSHKALSDSSSVIVTDTLGHQWIPAFWVLAAWTTCLVSCDKHWILLHCNPLEQVDPGRSTTSKESTCNAGDTGDSGSISESGRSPGGGNATHSSIRACNIPWIEEPGRLQSMGSPKCQTWLSD